MLVVNPSGHRSLDVCDDSSFLPPRVVLWAPVVLELMGRNISLPCNAIGHPSPVVRWLDDDGRPIGSALSHGIPLHLFSALHLLTYFLIPSFFF